MTKISVSYIHKVLDDMKVFVNIDKDMYGKVTEEECQEMIDELTTVLLKKKGD